jgi:hypothetical protein
LKNSISYLPPNKSRASLNPFTLNVEPLKRLLLVNFNKDPDSVYLGFEPQLFEDEVMGKGLLVIAWRKDEEVDVYHAPSLSPDPDKYDIAGKGLNLMQETDFSHSLFDIQEAGVNVEIVFKDRFGRLIEIKIHEQNPNPREPFGLLAPMGMAAKHPSAMPLIWLHEFYFVRRKKTYYHIRIDGKSHSMDKLPLPLDFCWMYFSRYSNLPFILTLNPDYKGILRPDGLNPTQTTRWKELGKYREIMGIKVWEGSLSYTMGFHPAFPDFANMEDGQSVEGKFEIFGHPSCGKVSGSYLVRTVDGDSGEIVLNPNGGWQPSEKKWVLRLIYALESGFKMWPKTYQWKARWKFSEKACAFESKWSRV